MDHPPPTRFVASEYRVHRPMYPAFLFQELKKRLEPKSIEPLTLLDLGCGTGQSTQSFLSGFQSIREVTFVDPDLAMLEECRKVFSDSPFPLEFIRSKAEDAYLGERKFDVILIGSALHWMKSDVLIEKIKKHLAGFLFIFEYQFPRSLHRPDLNEWVRKKFNTSWKAPKQTPRGSFRELILPFDHSFRRVPMHVADWKVELKFEEFLGQIFSQSRYLHSETGFGEDEIRAIRDEIASELKTIWGSGEKILFDFYLDAALYY